MKSISLMVILMICMKLSKGQVDEKIFNLKYRKSLQSWLLDFVMAQDGYDTCMLLDGACCFLPNQIIKSTQTTFEGKIAIQYKGQADGNCYQKELIILVYGFQGDIDLTSFYGKYVYASTIGSPDGQIYEGAKNQFLLAIDDQQNEYILKLPSLAGQYSDNDSYNYARIIIATTFSQTIQITFVSILLLFLLF